MLNYSLSPVRRILQLLAKEKIEISQIYFYAILYGIITLTIPIGIQALITYSQSNVLSATVIILLILIVVSVLLTGVLQINQMKIIEKIQQKIFVRYAFAFADKLPKIQISEIDNYYLPELVNRFFDTLTLQKKIAKILLDFPLAIVQILTGLILLALYHPVFIAFGLVLVIVVFCILYFSGTKGLKTSIEESTYKFKTVAWLQEVARIIFSAKFFRNSFFPIKKADEHVHGYIKSRTAHFKVLLIQYKTLVAFKVIVTAVMLLAGTQLLISQQLSVGQFIASEIVIIMVLNSVEKLIINLDSVYDVLTAIEKIEQLIDKPSEEKGTIVHQPCNRGLHIQIKNLSFEYGSGQSVFKDLSLEIMPNKIVGVCGEKGAGKSTLMRLLAGFYNNYTGSILIDDIPINNYDMHSLRSHIGLKLNQQDIFDGTILENIVMGSEGYNMEEIKNLCRKLGLLDFIASYKEGFNTLLSTSGKKLPSNAIKKILLVRAFLNSPSLLLLEEPWATLDTESASSIKNYILHELPATTTIVITEDADFLKKCHQVININNIKNI